SSPFSTSRSASDLGGANRSTNARTVDSGTAPMNESTTFLSLMANTAGIDWTRNALAIAGLASTSTLASTTLPSDSPTTFSRMGPSVLHGPHHEAHRSM